MPEAPDPGPFSRSRRLSQRLRCRGESLRAAGAGCAQLHWPPGRSGRGTSWGLPAALPACFPHLPCRPGAAARCLPGLRAVGTPLSSLACQTDRCLQRATTLAPQSPTSNPATPPFPAPPCRLSTTPVLPSPPRGPAPLSLHTALCPDLLPFHHHIPTEMLVANTLHSRSIDKVNQAFAHQ